LIGKCEEPDLRIGNSYAAESARFDGCEVLAMTRAAVVALATLGAFDLLMYGGRHTTAAVQVLSMMLRSYRLI
jgi:hypothetical protein